MPESLSSFTTLTAASLAILWSLAYLAGRARHYYYVRNLPYVHDVSRPSRWFTSKARHQFIGNFRALMRKGFTMVTIPPVNTENSLDVQPERHKRLIVPDV
jgi:hypothetical protein